MIARRSSFAAFCTNRFLTPKPSGWAKWSAFIPRQCWPGTLANAFQIRSPGNANESAWDEAFRWRWPVAFAVAQLKLQPFLPQDVEDVAIEALEALVEMAREVKSVEEL